MVRRHDLFCKAPLGHSLQDPGRVVVEREGGTSSKMWQRLPWSSAKIPSPPFPSVKADFFWHPVSIGIMFFVGEICKL